MTAKYKKSDEMTREDLAEFADFKLGQRVKLTRPCRFSPDTNKTHKRFDVGDEFVIKEYVAIGCTIGTLDSVAYEAEFSDGKRYFIWDEAGVVSVNEEHDGPQRA